MLKLQASKLPLNGLVFLFYVANFLAESIAMIALKFDLQVYLSNILLYRNHCHNINVLIECCCTEQIEMIFIIDLQYLYQYVPFQSYMSDTVSSVVFFTICTFPLGNLGKITVEPIPP